MHEPADSFLEGLAADIGLENPHAVRYDRTTNYDRTIEYRSPRLILDTTAGNHFAGREIEICIDWNLDKCEDRRCRKFHYCPHCARFNTDSKFKTWKRWVSHTMVECVMRHSRSCKNWNGGLPCRNTMDGCDLSKKHVCSFCGADDHRAPECVFALAQLRDSGKIIY
jgi:hypothetical protein